MNIGTTNSAATWQVQRASDTLGEAKPLSDLFSVTYSAEDRQKIADRHLQSIQKFYTSRRLSVENATASLEKYQQQIEYYSDLLQTQSNDSNENNSQFLQKKIEEYQTYVDGYQAQLDFYENNPIEDDAVRNHLFKTAASMMGLSTQEVMEDYGKGQ